MGRVPSEDEMDEFVSEMTSRVIFNILITIPVAGGMWFVFPIRYWEVVRNMIVVLLALQILYLLILHSVSDNTFLMSVLMATVPKGDNEVEDG